MFLLYLWVLHISIVLFHMQISVLDKKKDDFLYLLGTETVNGNGRWNSISPFISPGIKIESICFKLVESVLLIACYIKHLYRRYVLTTTVSYFLNDETLFGSCRVMRLLSSLSKLSMCSCCLHEIKKTSWHWCYKKE
jgi:hypothetical protein